MQKPSLGRKIRGGSDRITVEAIRAAVEELTAMYQEELVSDDPHPEEMSGWVAWLYAELLEGIRDGMVDDVPGCIAEALKLEEL